MNRIKSYLALCYVVVCHLYLWIRHSLLPKIKNKLKKILSSWQGFAAGLAALGIYVLTPTFLRYLDPTAGAFDAGILQVISLAMLIFYLGIFTTWTGWQLAFKSLDKEVDERLEQWFDSLPNWVKYLTVQLTFVLMMLFWVVCVGVTILLII